MKTEIWLNYKNRFLFPQCYLSNWEHIIFLQSFKIILHFSVILLFSSYRPFVFLLSKSSMCNDNGIISSAFECVDITLE